MMIPVYMEEADLARKPRPEYYKAKDLAEFERILRAGAEGSNDMKSADTMEYYVNQLRRLTELLGHDVEWMLSNSLMATEALLGVKRRDKRSMIEEWGTLRGFVVTVLAVFKHAPGAQERWPEGLKVWSGLLSERIKPLVKAKDELSSLTARQAEGWVEWSDVEKKTKELLETKPRSVEVLLLAVYTMRTGVTRADFGDLRIYRPPQDPVPAAGSKELQQYPNYVEWSRSSGVGNGEMELTLGAYQTSKHYGQVKEKLSAELTAVIVASLREKPRKWLFVQPSTGEPYDGKEFSRMACRALRRAFGKPVTLQGLRRSGATALDLSMVTEVVAAPR